MDDPLLGPDGRPLTAVEYCASFIDLLGQRAALHGQGRLPRMNSEAARSSFAAVLRNSVLATKLLQDRSQELIQHILAPNPNSPHRAQLAPHLHAEWHALMLTRVKTQRWSDGLVSFASLADPEIRCKVNGVYSIVAQAGAVCLLGLASRYPVRGAVALAWGVELYRGEIYGAIVARAYELESEIAAYPRIVVDEDTVKYLERRKADTEADLASRNDQALAETCLRMLTRDDDGRTIVDYLGGGFRDAVTRGEHDGLYDAARTFVVAELQKHGAVHNEKLRSRYQRLLGYFDRSIPGAAAAEPAAAL